MKRFFALTILSLLAFSSSALAGKGGNHKPENQTNKPKPIVRDHRAPSVAPVVRDHRPQNAAPVVRDHRTTNGYDKGKPAYGIYGQSNNSQSNLSSGAYISTNGFVQRAPAVSKPLVPLTHPMSPQTPPRDPRKPLSSQNLVSPGAKDQRFTPITNSGAVVRDHRDQTGYGQYSSPGRPNVSSMSGGVMVTNTNVKPSKHGPKPIDSKVTVAPDLSVRGPAPIVRDHRTMTSTAANYNWPSINQTPSPVVRDHRTATTQNAGPVVRDHRKPVDNTIYGTGPGLGDVLDAGMTGLTKVGNVFGIGYGSVTSGAPTRPQTVDHRNR